MKAPLVLGLFILLVQQSVAPPVHTAVEEEEIDEDFEEEDLLEYQRYMKEVVEALESDEEFREKLTKANESDIRSGKIAHELDYVNHQVRFKLDEIKRREIERLRHLATKQFELENGLDIEHLKITEHLDHENPHTFEVDDLKKLIFQSSKDIDEADKKRREEFKKYEMEKKFEQEQKLQGLDEKARKKYEEEIHDLEEKHKKHEPLHHPGSKQQLEEVWEKEDHMESEDFNPKTFFFLHDLDGNGFWDHYEVKALFRKELDKAYAEGQPEDDLIERAEEMERMREHVFKEQDLNHDGLISLEEYLQQTQKPDFEQDEEWKTLDVDDIFSDDEYEDFEKHRIEEIGKTNKTLIIPPDGHPPPKEHPQESLPHSSQQVISDGKTIQQQAQQTPQQYQQNDQVQGQVPIQQNQQQPNPAQVNQQPLGQVNLNQVPYQGQPVPQQQQYQQQYVQPIQVQGRVPNQQYQAQYIPAQQQYQQYNQVQGQVPIQQYQQQQIPAQATQQTPGQVYQNQAAYQGLPSQQQEYQQQYIQSIQGQGQVPIQQYQQQPIPAQPNQQPLGQVYLNQGPYQGVPVQQQQIPQQYMPPLQVQGQVPIQQNQAQQSIPAQVN